MTRGILATVYAALADDLSQAEALSLYDDCYGGAPFMRVLHDALPETKATLGSNYCDVTVSGSIPAPGRRLPSPPLTTSGAAPPDRPSRT